MPAVHATCLNRQGHPAQESHARLRFAAALVHGYAQASKDAANQAFSAWQLMAGLQ